MAKQYEISDEDIEAAMRFLKYHDPRHATCEDAKVLLEDLRTGFHGLSHSNPELLLKFQQELKKNTSADAE